MGLIQRFREVLRGAPAPAPQAVVVQKGGGNWQILWARARESELLTGSLTEPYSQHPVVYAAVSAIAGNLAAVPLESFPTSDTKREKPVTDSQVLEVLENPNPYMQGNQLIEATLASMELYGNALWLPSGAARRTGDGKPFPTRIDFLEWDAVVPLRDGPGGPIMAFEYRGSPSRRLGPDQVRHFKTTNPYDKYLGMAPMEAALMEASNDYRASKWNESYFKNSAVPSGFLTPKEGQIVKEESLERMRDAFENRHMGERKHGKIGVLTAAFEWLGLGTDPKDMDFVNLRYIGQEKILMVFKVPPVVAGVLRDANYNLALQQTKQFWHTHTSKLLYVVGVINRTMVKPAGLDEALYPKWEVVKALIEDAVAQATTAREYFNMGVPFDDINRRLELGYDTKGHKAHKIPWLPFSLQNADLAADIDPAEKPTAVPGQQPPGDQNQPGDDTDRDPPEKTVTPATTADALEIARTVVWKSVISRVRNEERMFDQRTRDHLYSLKKEVMRNLDAELSRNGQRHLRPVEKQDDPAQFEVDAVLFDKDAAAKDIKKKTEPVYTSSAQKAAKSVQQELSISFDLLTQATLDYVDRKVFQIAGLVDEPVIAALRQTLRDGLAEGDTPEDIKERIDQVFDVERSRAKVIARTEVNSTFSNGRADSFRAAGVAQIQWITARDARVRGNDPDDQADHVSLDGNVVDLGNTFDNGLRWALDENGPVHEVANCRCVNVAVG